MTRTYRMSRSVALYFAAFSLVWFGAFVLLAIQLPPAPTLAIVVVLTGLLVIALLPAAATAVLPYRITLSDEGLCVCRSLLRERRIEVHHIHEIGGTKIT